MEFILGQFIFYFTVVLLLTYLMLGTFSAISLNKYFKKNSFVNFNTLVTSPLSPHVSIIAPAYNEGKTIIDNIRTLLSLYYNNYEVIIVNDGSTDDSLQKVIDAYQLVRVNYFFDYRMPCERIRGVYRSENPSYARLTVIDKANGGKSDALNAGINVSRNDIVVSIDTDSIIESDALLKLVKPFLEEKEKKVIGTGGVIRIVNSCEVVRGHIKKVNLPKSFLPRLQVLEYTRAFLLGRMAWSQLDGLMLISGAMGMFDKEVLIKAGGYSTKTVGEDMELVLRMRRYMTNLKQKYVVSYIPDPLCWTEAPDDLRMMTRQRSRWTRGLVQSLYAHRGMFLNPKYRNLGLLSFPYWIFFEWLAPLLALAGFIYTAILIITHQMNWPFFILLFIFVYSVALMLSTWSILYEEVTFHKYRKKRDVLKLFFTAMLEPFFYPVHTWFALKGNWDALMRKKAWGKQRRKGFSGS
ncbi:cellulose synthase/poly-beta-1,6-N-acetylglucosamine synthase-like glycosyltransferase [Breznakibacter xylanolyticus]|uniref:Cellulose synthase/poly-beta-1,6-N-acetylglucosamine synthase-like glycosyltransferase n=1 Tax=Breznakibacter xylanolyticus TaxID=990 RepID=A0A2W7NUH2_9BACT|nr:glycosyltransferase [Breznakibacter xylanolyticus]MBN2744379.1 glycosyltransferase family 2 protein [Marinilabiliaceae bacterium]PZX20254.1 cellulose synthase/poly-beta-1,6-N-acetylglucosamine synthase-like glycosyltransferase [Breznakibacter xylanolyticus]